ncbi:LuxR C-terminal-related transcriptional regulator [Pseudovibrio flavus]|uniref:LuxR C-terminal-related transcriptional regulator n=1 Tax=Pseudovibrio flavus TaxID=2529854 RepID=UPI00211C2099|nr:response regulator transcription factor [Pseudovibrio flavus]
MFQESYRINGPMADKPSAATVIIADQHPAFAQALAVLFQRDGLATKVFTTQSFSELQDLACAHSGSTVLVNPSLEGAPGLTTALALREKASISKLIILSDNDNPGLGEYFINHGAHASISKTADFEIFVQVLKLKHAGVVYPHSQPESTSHFTLDFYEGLASLTRRQATILRYLKEGKLNKQIAHDLGISEATVKHHVSALLSTLGFYSRSQLVAMINAIGISVDYRPGSRAKSSQRRTSTPARLISPSSIQSLNMAQSHRAELAAAC